MTEEILVRLKKAADGRILGPYPLQTLQQYAQSALIAPEDEVDRSDENWQFAHTLPELEMIYRIISGDGNSYGPTTRGTIHEFLVSGELTPNDTVENIQTGESRTVKDFLGVSVVLPTQKNTPLLDEQVVAETDETITIAVEPVDDPSQTPTLSEDAAYGQDLAKDLQIRQLKADLETLKADYEDLLQKYRKLTEK